MNIMEELMNHRYIIKAIDREKYYMIKEGLESVENFLKEKLGYQIMINPTLIKLEKIPGKVEPWMGITAFTSVMDYGFLCTILMFLEDKDREEQFILSQLTEYIQTKYSLEKVEWTNYQMRRALIRVIKFCVQNKLIFVNDGRVEDFVGDANQEVLYENTGVSRYFMKNFTQDIIKYQSKEAFENSDWLDMDEDRGVLRRHRVYRRLLMSMGVYKEIENDEDFNYIKTYWSQFIEPDFQKYFDCKLHVHKYSAYLILEKESRMGWHFPDDKGVSDIILLLNKLLIALVKEKKITLNFDESIRLSITAFDQILEECRRLYGSGFGKQHRDLTSTEFVEMVKKTMESLGLILIDLKKMLVIIYPAIGKMIGNYPKDYKGEERHGNEFKQA